MARNNIARAEQAAAAAASQENRGYNTEEENKKIAKTNSSFTHTDTQKSNLKRPAENTCPLDLTTVANKRHKVEEDMSTNLSTSNLSSKQSVASSSQPRPPHSSLASSTQSSPPYRPAASSKDDISSWSVDDVQEFVNSIELCAEYSQVFNLFEM